MLPLVSEAGIDQSLQDSADRFVVIKSEKKKER